MNLTLHRLWHTNQSTIGILDINGSCLLYTLEDPIRKVKIPGQTAIPAGKYSVILDHSPKFNRILPLVLEVPNFTDIRIHVGNWPRDTEGCILVGMTRTRDFIGHSGAALAKLMQYLDTASDITLEVINHVEPS